MKRLVLGFCAIGVAFGIVGVAGCSKSSADKIAKLLPEWDASMSAEKLASEVADFRKLPADRQEALACQLELMLILRDVGIGSTEQIKSRAGKMMDGKSPSECREIIAQVENEYKDLLEESRRTYTGSPVDYIASMLPKLDPGMEKDEIDSETAEIKKMPADQQEALVYRMKLMLLLKEAGWGTMRMIKREAEDRMKGKTVSECKAALARMRFELKEVLEEVRKGKK